ncbi:MAG: DUF2339 domain-containing protein [Actinomycetaceae bacterium]|nr:DUF2339 domain-containing protein [Actinomycetaceae bacterium]
MTQEMNNTDGPEMVTTQNNHPTYMVVDGELLNQIIDHLDTLGHDVLQLKEHLSQAQPLCEQPIHVHQEALDQPDTLTEHCLNKSCEPNTHTYTKPSTSPTTEHNNTAQMPTVRSSPLVTNATEDSNYATKPWTCAVPKKTLVGHQRSTPPTTDSSVAPGTLPNASPSLVQQSDSVKKQPVSAQQQPGFPQDSSTPAQQHLPSSAPTAKDVDHPSSNHFASLFSHLTKKKNLESFVGRFVLAGLSALLILAAAGSFVGIFWWRLSATGRLSTIAVSGLVLMTCGWILNKKKPHLWIPAHTLVASGSALCGISIATASSVFHLIALPVALLLMIIWALILVTIVHLSGDFLTNTICALGVLFMTYSVMSNTEQLSPSGAILLIALLVTYLLASTFSISRLRHTTVPHLPPPLTMLFLLPTWISGFASILVIINYGLTLYGLELIVILLLIFIALSITEHLPKELSGLGFTITVASYLSVLHINDIIVNRLGYSWLSMILFVLVWAVALSQVVIVSHRQIRFIILSIGTVLSVATTLMIDPDIQAIYHATSRNVSDTLFFPHIVLILLWIIAAFALLHFRSFFHQHYTPLLAIAIPAGLELGLVRKDPIFFWPILVLFAAILVYATIIVKNNVKDTNYYHIAAQPTIDSDLPHTHIERTMRISDPWIVWMIHSWALPILGFTLLSLMWVNIDINIANFALPNALFNMFLLTCLLLVLHYTGWLAPQEKKAKIRAQIAYNLPHQSLSELASTLRGSPRELTATVAVCCLFVLAPIGQRKWFIQANTTILLEVSITLLVAGTMLGCLYLGYELLSRFHTPYNDLVLVAALFYLVESLLYILGVLGQHRPVTTLVIIACGGLSIGLGLQTKRRISRIAGLTILIVGVLKLTVVDVASHQPLERIASLLAGAVACFIVSIAYSKLEARINAEDVAHSFENDTRFANGEEETNADTSPKGEETEQGKASNDDSPLHTQSQESIHSGQ